MYVVQVRLNINVKVVQIKTCTASFVRVTTRTTGLYEL